jgi:hypothetical protein
VEFVREIKKIIGIKFPGAFKKALAEVLEIYYNSLTA